MDKEKKEASVKVDGITCPGCAMDAEKIIGDVKGISKTNVRYADSTVDIEYDPAAFDKEEFLRTLLRIGFNPAKK